MNLYFASDNNIGSLTHSLNITKNCFEDKYINGKDVSEYDCPGQPTFGSNLIWEMYSKNENETQDPNNWYFKVKYNDMYYDICGAGGFECQYPKMIELLETFMIGDSEWKKICKTKEELTPPKDVFEERKNFYLAISIAIAVSLLIFQIALCKKFQTIRKKYEDYQHDVKNTELFADN